MRIDPQDMDAIGNMVKTEVAPIQVAVARIEEKVKSDDERWNTHEKIHEKDDKRVREISKKADAGVKILWGMTAIGTFVGLFWAVIVFFMG